jgi:moderate conductance mechanosensitive channel
MARLLAIVFISCSVVSAPGRAPTRRPIGMAFPAAAVLALTDDEGDAPPAGEPDPRTEDTAVPAGAGKEQGSPDEAKGEDEAPESKEPPVARLSPKAEAEAEAVSEAEQITRLQRAIEADQEQLLELVGEKNDPESEYAKAEAEFEEADTQLEQKKKALKALKGEGKAEEAKAAEAEIADLEKSWGLSKERFDLAIDARKALQEQIATLEKKIGRQTAALNRLTGEGEPEKPEEDPAPERASSKDKKEAEEKKKADDEPAKKGEEDEKGSSGDEKSEDSDEMKKGESGASDPEDEPEPEDEDLVQAREDAKAKAQAAKEAEQEARSVSERLEVLDKDISLEKQLLETARKKSDNANNARQSLAEDLQKKSVAGAAPEVLQKLVARIQDAERRFRDAREEVAARTDRLDELQSERARLLSEQVLAQQNAEKTRLQLEEAQDRIKQLQNPFTPRNILQWALDHGPKILAIFVAMFVFQRTAKVFSRRIVTLMANGGLRGTKEEREDRANTLVGVFHNAVTVTVVGGGTLMILQEAGIPIAPLLGGAAVFGLAVAFGAQNLIRDYFYGFVILLENQYKINDVVKIGDVSGQVERITLRMTVIRDIEGSVHFLPNGQITAVTNMTHGWSRAVFDIGVSYGADVDRVMDVLIELGKAMRQDPAFATSILEDPTMLGVDALADSGVVIKFFIKTRTLQQWAVKRELLRRIKNKFDELGIEIPYPSRTVYHRYEEAAAEPVPPPSHLGQRVRSGQVRAAE